MALLMPCLLAPPTGICSPILLPSLLGSCALATWYAFPFMKCMRPNILLIAFLVVVFAYPCKFILVLCRFHLYFGKLQHWRN